MLHLNTHPLGNHTSNAVLMVGSIAYDAIETPFSKIDRALGGSAVYAGIAASFFAPVSLVGVIGNDFEEADILKLKQHGLDLTGVETLKTEKTFFWKGKYLNGFIGRETHITELNAFAHFNPTLSPTHKTHPYIFLGNISPSLQHKVLDQVTHRQFVAADTMNYWIKNEKESLIELIKRIDALIINDEEALELTETYHIVAAGKKLQSLGVPYVIIKKGEHGAAFFYQNELFVLPAYPTLNLKDPTGAGDTFAGSFIGYIAAHQTQTMTTLKNALLYATAAASLTVEDFSCEALIKGGKIAIDNRVATLKNMISF